MNPRPPRYNPGPRAPHYPRLGTHINVTHKPYVAPRRVTRYAQPRDFYINVYVRHIYLTWIMEPVRTTYYDGYWEMDDYPYYVDNGYRYRYTPVETCRYELVDGLNYSVVKTYPNQACNVAYDKCAVERDTKNASFGSKRYFCAEKVDDDLQNRNTNEYTPVPYDISAELQALIDAYLEDKSLMDIFEDGYWYGVNSCVIVGLTGNEDDCDYIIKVGQAEEWYPYTDGSICSDASVASKMGCNVGTEEENAGCILQKAIQEGYCH